MYRYICDRLDSKNIIYLNRPKHTHSVAKELIKVGYLAKISDNEAISEACENLSRYFHKDYF